MDIAGTKKKIQRVAKIVEETYKKMNEMLERMTKLQEDVETTSSQVDRIEEELAEQRALLTAIAAEHDLDVEDVLADVDYPEQIAETEESAKQATSRPSAEDE